MSEMKAIKLNKGAVRAYDEPIYFTPYLVDDEADTQRVFHTMKNWGPVFPYLLETDFSDLDSFIWFGRLFGFEGFIPFRQGLEEELAQAKASGVPLRKTYLKEVLKDIGPRMNKEQETMALFGERFVRYFPESMKKGTGDTENRELVEIVNEETRGVGHFIKWPELEVIHSYPSIVSRCFFELLHLSQDGRRLKRCNNCGKFFVTGKRNENYCDRLDPVKVYALKDVSIELGETGVQVQTPYGEEAGFRLEEKLRCKTVGPVKTWRESLTKEEQEFQKEKKRRQTRFYYVRNRFRARKVSKEAYEKAKLDYETWREKNDPKKEVKKDKKS